jgi:shikimate kinase
MAVSLSPDRLPPMRNIVFVGLMGAGKTTVGRRLAKRHDMPFLDTDHEIERRCGAPISTIFDLEGEDGFRRREARVIADAMAMTGHVVTTGGGAILLPENREALRRGFVIYLDADPEQLWMRLRNDTSRPLLRQSGDPKATLTALHARRDPLYREVADLIVPTTKASVSVVMRAIEQGLEQAEVLST